ncbi:carbohydrate ABC transporter permease [Aestuariimicrobium ganziense]|uniref:carbohydrate ABC transporter permease n=1 Tax=Aestuariimicrobium ganziense TaxID=2773677 RepID=UPI0019407A5D|nr:carbohydrate ABC transporter permease [Aestuariimicrobium ganziense]
MSTGSVPTLGSAEAPITPAPEPGTVRRVRRRNPNRPVYQEEPKAITKISKGVLLTIIVLTVIFPLWSIIITSFSTNAAVTRAGGMVVLPDELTIAAYRQIIAGGIVTRAVGVSVFVTGVGTLLSTTLTILAAWGLSKPTSFGHRPILFIFLMTMFFGAGMIPSYLLISNLGLLNSLWALILPGAVSAFNVLITRNFFMAIEPAIIEAARIDGAGEWRILSTIVVPLSRAVIAVVALFYGVGYWNAFFNAMLYINDNTKWPLQLVLRSYVLQGQAMPGADPGQIDIREGQVTGLPIQMAVVVLALVPILMIYPFVQRHFTKGVIFGAVKG